MKLQNKIFKIVYYIFIGFIILIAGLLIISILPITGDIKFLVVQSGSMEPAIRLGSIVMIKPESEYKIGDVITFGRATRLKAPITHRIYDVKMVEGKVFYITKGDANNAPDQKEISKKEVLGKVLLDVPYVGYAVDFAKKPLGFILIIIVPALLIIYDEARKIYEEMKAKESDRNPNS